MGCIEDEKYRRWELKSRALGIECLEIQRQNEDYVLTKYTGGYKKVIVPDFVSIIGRGAFSFREVEEVVLPESIKKINEEAFIYCRDIKRVEFPMGHTYKIGEYAFRECTGLERLVLNNVNLSMHAFSGCTGIKDVKISSGYIGRYSFSGCKQLENLDIGNCDIIECGAFSRCINLKQVEHKKLKEIRGESFMHCSSLTKLSLAGVKAIGDDAFNWCKKYGDGCLEAPDLEYLGSRAFAETAIREIIIPKVRDVGSYVFFNCINLKEVESNRLVAKMGEAGFLANNGNVRYKVRG